MEQSGLVVQDLLQGLWRRRRLVVGVFAVVFAVSVAIVALLPRKYQASAVGRLEPQRPSPELIPPSVSQTLEDRLGTLPQELLARPVLEQTISELDLFPQLRRKRGMPAAVDRLRTMLDVKTQQPLGFELTAEGSDPEPLARIVNRLPMIWAGQVSQDRIAQARRAATVFDGELAHLGEQLQAVEGRIGAFKQAHLGELPEQGEGNLRAYERTMADIATRNEVRLDLLRRTAELDQAHGTGETQLGRLRARENELSKDLVTARSQWTEGHPEVSRIERELGEVRQRRIRAEQGQLSDPDADALRGQAGTLGAELRALQKQAETYRKRLDVAPRWGHQLAVLESEHEMLRAKYQSLLSRKVETEIALNLEEKTGPNLVKVVSEASVPREPFKPDRAAGVALALLAAIAAGALTGIFRELHDDSLRRAEQLRELDVPLLAVVPKIPAGTRGR